MAAASADAKSKRETSDVESVSALWETSWIRIYIEDADPDPGGKKSPKMRLKSAKTKKGDGLSLH